MITKSITKLITKSKNWHFGVIAFEAFSGQRPFTTGIHDSTSEAGRQELFRQINNGSLPDAIWQIPEPWQALIRKCLITDVTQRLKSMQEAKALLDDKGKPVFIPKSPITNQTDDTKYDPPQINRDVSPSRSVSVSPPDIVDPPHRPPVLRYMLIALCSVFIVALTLFVMQKMLPGSTTKKEWRAVMGNNPSYFKGDNLPVEQMSWNDIQKFIRKLNALSG